MLLSCLYCFYLHHVYDSRLGRKQTYAHSFVVSFIHVHEIDVTDVTPFLCDLGLCRYTFFMFEFVNPLGIFCSSIYKCSKGNAKLVLFGEKAYAKNILLAELFFEHL